MAMITTNTNAVPIIIFFFRRSLARVSGREGSFRFAVGFLEVFGASPVSVFAVAIRFFTAVTNSGKQSLTFLFAASSLWKPFT